MLKIQKNLVNSYSAEFDIGGVYDPFLQVAVLNYFRLIGQGSEEISEEVVD